MRASLAAAMVVVVALSGARAAHGQGMPATEQERVQTRELPPIEGTAPPAPFPSAPAGASGSRIAAPLPASLWRGMSAQELAALLDQAPKPQRSRALRQALAGALATPDAGDAGLAVGRLSALYQAGLIEAAAQAATGGDPVAEAVQARALLAKGARDAACAKAAALSGAQGRGDLTRTGVVLRLICDLAAGNSEAAQLAVTVARDRGVEAAFAFAVVDQLAGGARRNLPLPKTVEVEDYVLMTLAKMPVGGEAVGRATPALLIYLASDAQAPEMLRLAAAERAAALDLVPGGVLARAYGAPRFARAEIAKILGEPKPSARQRALLFQAMAAAGEPKEKAKLLRALAGGAGTAGLQQAIAEAVQRELAKLAAEPALLDFADTALRVAALAGDAATAERWLTLAEGSPATRAMAGRWRIALEVAGFGRPGGTQATLDTATELALSGALGAELQHRLVTVLDALGYQVPIPLWEAASRTAQPAGGYLPETGHLSRLSEASQRGEAARVLLLALHALGPEGPAGAHLIALGDAVRALKAAGFGEAARGAAFEALFALMPAGSQG